jgi:hypothetical protein
MICKRVKMQERNEGIGADQPDERSGFHERHSQLEPHVQPPPDNPFARWRGYLIHLAGRDIDQIVEEMRGR